MSLSAKNLAVGIVIGLAIGVIIGYFLSIVTLARLYHTLGEQEAYINGLKDEIYSKDVEINDLQSQLRDLSLAYEELADIYSPKPPISKDQAIDIALEYGQWNEISLANMEVTANLECYMYLKSGSEFGFSFLHNVTAHVPDYGTKEMVSTDGLRITFRYVWVVVVSQRGEVKSIPPPGLYHVDASTGGVVFHCDSYPCVSLQVVVDEACKELEHKGLIDKVAILAYNDVTIELGFYGEADPEVVEIVKAVIDRRAPGVPLEVVENVTIETP